MVKLTWKQGESGSGLGLLDFGILGLRRGHWGEQFGGDADVADASIGFAARPEGEDSGDFDDAADVAEAAAASGHVNPSGGDREIVGQAHFAFVQCDGGLGEDASAGGVGGATDHEALEADALASQFEELGGVGCAAGPDGSDEHVLEGQVGGGLGLGGFGCG